MEIVQNKQNQSSFVDIFWKKVSELLDKRMDLCYNNIKEF